MINDEVERMLKPFRWEHYFDPVEIPNRKRFWISVRRAENCLFGRRNGHKGLRLAGWSICVRLFGVDIL
jgi:hypothetical protein